VDDLGAALSDATDKVEHVFITVDPVRKMAVRIDMRLSEPLEPGSEKHFANVIRGWAAVNDVDVLKVTTQCRRVLVDAHVKYLGGGECRHSIWDLRPAPRSRHRFVRIGDRGRK